MDAGLDMVDMVHHACHHYDTNVHFDGTNFESGVAPASRAPTPDHHGSAMGPNPGTNDVDNEIGDDAAHEGNTETNDGHPESSADTDWGVNAEGDDDIPSDDESSDSYGLNEELLEEAVRLRLYPGSLLSSLSATLLLLMCCRLHGCSSTFIDELFKLLSKSILPTSNTLPTSEYLASKKLRQLGLSFKSIHACQNSCLLFRGEYASNTHCAKCGAPRYRRVGKSQVPFKVLRHFPLIPRIRRMFSTPLQASFMTWHMHYRSTDGMMRCVPNSPQWKQIDLDHPIFASEPRNLRFAMATDGVNPFGVKRSTWSTWPVMLLNYNVPPWLTTKKPFILLSLIIPGKKSVTGDNFDVYVQPLLEELQYGWSVGVRVMDAANYMGSATFDCRFMCMFTINDYPALGIVSGVVTKGYLGCSCCGPCTASRRSAAMKKKRIQQSASNVAT